MPEHLCRCDRCGEVVQQGKKYREHEEFCLNRHLRLREQRRLDAEHRELKAELARLRVENAALLKQWNDLDQRTERNHRDWHGKMAALRAAWTVMRDSVLQDPDMDNDTINHVLGIIDDAEKGGNDAVD